MALAAVYYILLTHRMINAIGHAFVLNPHLFTSEGDLRVTCCDVLFPFSDELSVVFNSFRKPQTWVHACLSRYTFPTELKLLQKAFENDLQSIRLCVLTDSLFACINVGGGPNRRSGRMPPIQLTPLTHCWEDGATLPPGVKMRPVVFKNALQSTDWRIFYLQTLSALNLRPVRQIS